jgi:hypothetical protein
VKRLRRADGRVGAEQLRNADPDAWLTPAELVHLIEMVDEARARWAVDRDATTELDRLAPAARHPARLFEDRAQAISTTEKLVVSYRRSLAGWKFAAATGLDGATVAQEFGIGHVSHPDEDVPRWLAAGPLT